MSSSVHTIPRNRLRWIPHNLRLAHEYCFFLHDECVRLLAEYEVVRAYIVTVKFRSKVEIRDFSKIAKTSPIEAMRATGYPDEARRVILNTVTMAMVSDCLHHLYEALCCMEKRKVIVAHNLLRKPLTDNLMYLSWMLGDEDAFYAAFTAESGDAVISRAMASQRLANLETTLAALPISNVLTAASVHQSLFDRNNTSGLYGVFQHAVHLVTAKHAELRTEAENFNFIFKNCADDDLYELLYDNRMQDRRVKVMLANGLEEVRIICDLILHSRGKIPAHDNLVAIEMKRKSRPEHEKAEDRLRLRTLTRLSYDGMWSADGVTLPEYVCGYTLGYYVELGIDGRAFLIEEYVEGELVDSHSHAF
jgi:hypothetical protein